MRGGAARRDGGGYVLDKLFGLAFVPSPSSFTKVAPFFEVVREVCDEVPCYGEAPLLGSLLRPRRVAGAGSSFCGRASSAVVVVAELCSRGVAIHGWLKRFLFGNSVLGADVPQIYRWIEEKSR